MPRFGLIKRKDLIRNALHLSDRNYAIFITAIFLILGAISAYHHEMWRDEIQAWLLARDSVSIIDLLRNLKYEGHPGLWHLLLMPLSRITRSPIIMQIFHLMIAGASIYMLSRYSPFPRLHKTLFAFGYFLFYEYGVICRNYAPGVLLLFTFCALFKRRYTIFPLIGSILFLLAHTSVHCLIITIAIGMGLLVEYLFVFRRCPKRLGIWIGFLIIVLGLITSIIQLNPPEDTGFAVTWVTKYDPARIKDIFRIVERAFVPIPKFNIHYWNSNIVDNLPSPAKLKSIISGLVLIWMAILLLKRPVSLLIYISGTIGLLAFFYVKYFGSMRHHGFLFILFIVSVWVSYYCVDLRIFRPLNRLSSIFRRYLSIPLFLVLLVQLIGGGAAAGMDYVYIFSQGRATARYIRESGMEDLTMVGHVDCAVSTIAGYLGNKIHYISGDRIGSFVIWDKERTKAVSSDDILQKAKELIDPENQSVLIILNSALNKDALSRYSLTEISRFEPAVVSNEIYYLYLVKAGISR